MARTLAHNGMIYELPDDAAERLAAAGIVVPDPDGSADYMVPLDHLFDEVEVFASPAPGFVRDGVRRAAPIVVAGRGREGQR